MNRYPPPQSISVIKLIWAALVFSNVMYAAALYTTQGDFLSAPFPSDNPLLMPLIAIATMAFAISLILPKALWMKAGEKLKAAPSPASDQTLYASFFAPWIIRMALMESVSIYGFVLATTSHAPVAFVPFAMLGFLGQLSQYPSTQKIKDSLGAK